MRARKQRPTASTDWSEALLRRNVPGRQVCIAVTTNGIFLYGNRKAFQSLAKWMNWLAASDARDHYECHMMWHFSLPRRAKRPAVWTLFDRRTRKQFSSDWKRNFDVTFMVVEDSDLSRLRKRRSSRTLPVAWDNNRPDDSVAGYEAALGLFLCEGGRPNGADFQAGYKLILRAARNGDPSAQHWIARELATGENVKRDPRMAAYWYRRAARRNLASAQYNLGMMYFAGDGVPKSKTRARQWVLRAAEQGEILAQMLLADAYTTGELGFSIDARQAARWRSRVRALVHRSKGNVRPRGRRRQAAFLTEAGRST